MTGTRKKSLTRTFSEPENLQEQEYLLGVRDVAKMFSVTVSTVNQWVSKKWIKSYKAPATGSQAKDLSPSERNSRVWFTKNDCIQWGKIYYGIQPQEPTDKDMRDAVDGLDRR